LLSRSITSFLTPVLLPTFEEMFAGEAAVILPILIGIVQSFVTLLLFSFLFLIFAPICKKLLSLIKSEVLDTEKTAMKWGGVFVRLFDAFIFTFLLLLPIYGSLAAYVPAIEAVLVMTEQTETSPDYTGDLTDKPESEAKLIVSAISANPIVSIAKIPALQEVYSTVTQTTNQENNFSPAKVATSATEFLTRVEELSSNPGELSEDQLLDFIDYLQEDVLESDWFYSVAKTSIDTMISEIPMDELGELPPELTNIANMSREDFQANTSAVVDFTEYALRSDILDAMISDKLTPEMIMNDQFYQEFGKLLNATDQMVLLKASLLKDALGENSSYEIRRITDPAEAAAEIKAIFESVPKE
jgi:hypothetical protein